MKKKETTKDNRTRAQRRFDKWLDEYTLYHNGEEFVYLSRRMEFINYGLL